MRQFFSFHELSDKGRAAYSLSVCLGVWDDKNAVKKVGSDLLVTDILCLVGAEAEVGKRSNEGVDTAGKVTPDEVRTGSGLVAFGLQLRVVDDETSEPTEEECKQETFYVHNMISLKDKNLF